MVLREYGSIGTGESGHLAIGTGIYAQHFEKAHFHKERLWLYGPLLFWDHSSYSGFAFILLFVISIAGPSQVRTKKLDHSKLIPLWAETVLVGIPLVRYGILILGQMVFGLAEESWGDNKYPDVQAFRRRYPETFIGDGGFNEFLQTVLILLDTLFIFALPVLLVRLFQHFMVRRSHRERSVFPQVADKTVWPPPPNRPEV